MQDEIKKYGEEAYDIIKYAANDIGSRLPGSEGEKKFAFFMNEKLKELGLKPVVEKFLVAPRASIGGIPYAGWVGIIASIMLFFPQLAVVAFAALAATWVWLVVSVFLYKTWFDFAFHQEISQNVYAELLPKDGKYDYTIILSGHTDTSWNWKHSIKNPATVFVKMGLGVAAMLFLTVSALICTLQQFNAINPVWFASFYNWSRIVWVICIPLCYFITMWADSNERTASPGAMDNASGIAISYAITKYFKENPDKMPKNCRIIDYNSGSEEAGLRGALDFTKRHKGEAIFDNCYQLNIDGIGDKDYFEVITGDAWQFTKFDKDLEKMFIESMKEAGIEKPGCIVNPVGGCDSTPMSKAGVKTITFAAQNPVATNYYHTANDVPERIEPETITLAVDVVLKVIDKIADKENSK